MGNCQRKDAVDDNLVISKKSLDILSKHDASLLELSQMKDEAYKIQFNLLLNSNISFLTKLNNEIEQNSRRNENLRN
jgi:hypothetical protein